MDFHKLLQLRIIFTEAIGRGEYLPMKILQNRHVLLCQTCQYKKGYLPRHMASVNINLILSNFEVGK
jgi:hypothetical protein